MKVHTGKEKLGYELWDIYLTHLSTVPTYISCTFAYLTFSMQKGVFTVLIFILSGEYALIYIHICMNFCIIKI